MYTIYMHRTYRPNAATTICICESINLIQDFLFRLISRDDIINDIQQKRKRYKETVIKNQNFKNQDKQSQSLKSRAMDTDAL